MRSLSQAVPVLLAAAWAAAPATAQEDQVARRSFPFFDRTLTVDVQAQGPGVLHVMRGARSRVDVAARAERGVASFAMGGTHRNRLRLAAAGNDGVEYVVVVPERVSLHVQLPDRGHVVLAEPGSVTYRWEDPQPAGFPAGADPELTYHADTPPAQVAIPDLNSIRRIGLRFEGQDFRVGSSRPLALTTGRAQAIEIRVAGDPLDLVIRVPRHTREFELRAGSDVLVAIRAGNLTVGCSPATRQVLPGGRQWVDLTPVGGRLECGQHP
jgi:hypothetical protein